ncbi:MAG: ribonuclease H family protein [Bacteroidota bacterium]
MKKEKCSFLNKEVHYLGHKINAEGIHASDEKITAIDNFSVPKNKKELSTFCGMIKYYHRFLPSISKVMSPLFALEKVKSDSEWKWGKEENESYLAAKELLKSNTLLVHYDPTKPLYLTCDASSFGLGAVLEQECEKGVLKPVSYASRTLSKSEKNYSMTEKEGLGVVWAVVKFNKYLYGRKFEIWTDHKPLIGLLGERKAVPQIASGRIIRWCLTLSGYDYKLCYKPGCKIPNADCLSRFPIEIEHSEPPKVGEEVMLVEQLDNTNVKSDDIRRWTDRDPLLARVRSYVLQGWNDKNDDVELQPYFNRRNELTWLHFVGK